MNYDINKFKVVACVGGLALRRIVAIDLACDPRNRRLVLSQTSSDTQWLRGLVRGTIAWCDMESTREQRDILDALQAVQVSIEEAKAILAAWAAQEGVKVTR